MARTHSSLSGRQIHRLVSAGSVSGVNGALARLNRAGLLTASVRSYATLYRVNRDHVLWPVVEAALNATHELREHIRRYATDHGPAGAAVALSRSVERGDATADSDVDLLVVLADDVSEADGDDFVYELAQRVEAWSGNQPQIIRIAASELQDSARHDDPLVREWLAGATLAGELSLAGAR